MHIYFEAKEETIMKKAEKLKALMEKQQGTARMCYSTDLFR